ncbi:hypothetical protein HHI36_016957 [Cryptolaemus montrouzieri]|uniref:Uncharacterized protein n=1 Tax=Cryptolaemus montrouzieri TaxID=559131 RepID=A0ABD2NM76_9CUCU
MLSKDFLKALTLVVVLCHFYTGSGKGWLRWHVWGVHFGGGGVDVRCGGVSPSLMFHRGWYVGGVTWGCWREMLDDSLMMHVKMDLLKIKEISAFTEKPTRKRGDLPVNVIHKISDGKLITRPYGEAVLLELAENQVFLPNRVTNIIKPNIDQFASRKYGLKFIREKVLQSQPKPAAISEIVEL